MSTPTLNDRLRLRSLEARGLLDKHEQQEYLVLWARCHRQAGVHLARAAIFAAIAAVASTAALLLAIAARTAS